MTTSTPIRVPTQPVRIINTKQDYYTFTMDQFAEAGQGLLEPFIPNCPGGDFAYSPHTWSTPQRLTWFLSRVAPRPTPNPKANIMLQSVHIPRPSDRITLDPSTIDIRISPAEFARLESITHPGMRIWILHPGPDPVPHCFVVPSHVFVFTEEEKRKYKGGLFKKDGSDLPTLRGLQGRFETSGLGKVVGIKGTDSGAETMESVFGFYGAQQEKMRRAQRAEEDWERKLGGGGGRKGKAEGRQKK